MSDPQSDVTDPSASPPEPVLMPDEVALGTIGGLAFELMRAQYWTMRAHEPGVRGGDEPEDLHQMRIAIRRLRASLAVFEDALPVRAAALRERLGRVGSTLGAVRDLDVQLARVGTWSAQAAGPERDVLEAVSAALEVRRGQARKHVVALLGSSGFQRLLNSLEIFLSRGPIKRSPAARAAILDLAPELLHREHRRVVTFGEHIDPVSPSEALHALRIRCKRMRYAVDFFEPFYGKPARSYIKRLTALQDVLGAHQDAVAAAATLREVGLAERSLSDPARLLTVGALLERLHQEGEAARGRFPRRYRKVVGGPWRRLARAIGDGRAHDDTRVEEA